MDVAGSVYISRGVCVSIGAVLKRGGNTMSKKSTNNGPIVPLEQFFAALEAKGVMFKTINGEVVMGKPGLSPEQFFQLVQETYNE